jgi:hypothetical protein
VSLAGFLVGSLAALAIAGSAFAVGILRSPGSAVLVTGAAVLAFCLESLLAGTSVGRRLGHFGRNLFVSFVAAALALGAGATGVAGP